MILIREALAMSILPILKNTLTVCLAYAATLPLIAANVAIEKAYCTEHNIARKDAHIIAANSVQKENSPQYNPAYQEHIYTKEERSWQPLEKQRRLQRTAVITTNKGNTTKPKNHSRRLAEENGTSGRIRQYYFLTPSPYYPYQYHTRDHFRPKDEWDDYPRPGGQPYYGYGIYHRAYDQSLRDAYRYGFLPGFDIAEFYRESKARGEEVREHASNHYKRGLKHFREGRYHPATRYFKLAAETNQGNPTSRIYAAHALFAIGRYEDAVRYLRRAFELQPKIALLSYDIRKDYKDQTDFKQQLEKLLEAHQLDPDRIERLVLMGYIYFYTNQREKAYHPLFRAIKINPDDRLARLLLKHCELPDVVMDEIHNEG
jgi:tetratricopeptide (TPR) repeat protein